MDSDGRQAKKVILLRPRGFARCRNPRHRRGKNCPGLYGSPIYVRKEIVHNRHVVDDLRDHGAIFVDELNQVPSGGRVIFSAHGVVRRCVSRHGSAIEGR